MDVTRLLTRLYGDEGRQDPYPCHAALHRLGPVSPVPPRAEHRPVAAAAAVVVGYDLVGRVLRDPRWYKRGAGLLPAAGGAHRRLPGRGGQGPAAPRRR
ncbi:hypothetical protein [Micromonospora sp. KLBMP9576]|uniref:hypothetical protein n=1 Tax=Micromonospora sp. KLBMP9576 TaxID=3424769 RepID=UPI003D924E8C